MQIKNGNRTRLLANNFNAHVGDCMFNYRLLLILALRCYLSSMAAALLQAKLEVLSTKEGHWNCVRASYLERNYSSEGNLCILFFPFTH